MSLSGVSVNVSLSLSAGASGIHKPACVYVMSAGGHVCVLGCGHVFVSVRGVSSTAVVGSVQRYRLL